MLKGLERAWKGMWLRALASLSPRPTRRGAPDWSSRSWRVLYLRYDRVGDMILATGLIRAIAASHPTIVVDVLASPANAAVLQGNPHVRRTHVFARKQRRTWPALLRELRRERYDVVVDGMILTPSLTTLLLMLATGAPYRIGIGGRRNDFIYTLPVPAAPWAAHVIEQAAMTATPFGVDVSRTDWRPELFVTAGEQVAADARWREATGRGAVRLLVNLSSAQALNWWPDERFAEVLCAARTRHGGLGVLVIAAPGDAARAVGVAREVGVLAVTGTSLRDAIALVATADVVFTPDTSVAHMAAAFGKPVVVMALPRAHQFVPFRARGRTVVAPTDVLAGLVAGPVVEALDEVLRGINGR
jgi:ADP-heptose:LPS heptosyltransferase